MDQFVNSVPAWIQSLLLVALMCGGWRYGYWRLQRLENKGEDSATSQLTSASVALLGLLLAFTFSISMERHEQRRQMVVRHANTISDFAVCASMIQEPMRTELCTIIRAYVESLLAVRKTHWTEAHLQQALAANDRMHDEMQALVKRTIDAGTTIPIPLINSYNELTSGHEERLAAVRNRLPSSIVVLLFLSGIISMIQIGMQNGRFDEREITTGIGFIVLTSLSVWVTLGLNQAHGEINSISQEPLQRLLTSLTP